MNTINWQNTGLGSVPIQEDIDYFGFTIYCKPREFLYILPPRPDYDNVSYIMEMMSNGQPIAPPWLSVEWEDNCWQILNHEGRGRVHCAKKLINSQLIPVHVFPIGKRRRNLTEEMIKAEFIPQFGAVSSTKFKPLLEIK